jgi:hypothetical protein
MEAHMRHGFEDFQVHEPVGITARVLITVLTVLVLAVIAYLAWPAVEKIHIQLGILCGSFLAFVLAEVFHAPSKFTFGLACISAGMWAGYAIGRF